MATPIHIQPMPAFNPDAEIGASLATRWRTWITDFEMYLLASGITDVTRKRALLLYQSGPRVREMCHISRRSQTFWKLRPMTTMTIDNHNSNIDNCNNNNTDEDKDYHYVDQLDCVESQKDMDKAFHLSTSMDMLEQSNNGLLKKREVM